MAAILLVDEVNQVSGKTYDLDKTILGDEDRRPQVYIKFLAYFGRVSDLV